MIVTPAHNLTLATPAIIGSLNAGLSHRARTSVKLQRAVHLTAEDVHPCAAICRIQYLPASVPRTAEAQSAFRSVSPSTRPTSSLAARFWISCAAAA